MTKQIVLLFNEDGSDQVFAGTVVGAGYDADAAQITITTEKLVTFATLQRVFVDIGLEGFNEALLTTAANQSLEISYYKKESVKARSREEVLKTRLAILERHNQILERQLDAKTT